MKPIIRVTKRAARHLKEALASRARNQYQCLRLVPASGWQARLVLDEVRGEDEVIQVDGTPLLALAPALIPVLQGATLDYQETSEGCQLTLVK